MILAAEPEGKHSRVRLVLNAGVTDDVDVHDLRVMVFDELRDRPDIVHVGINDVHGDIAQPALDCRFPES